MTHSNDGGNSIGNKGTFEWQIGSLDALEHFSMEKAQNICGYRFAIRAMSNGLTLMFCADCNQFERNIEHITMPDGDVRTFHSNCNRNDTYNESFYMCKTTTKLEMEEEEVNSTKRTTVLIKDFGEQHWTNYFNWILSNEVNTKLTAGTFPKVLRMHIEVTWVPSEGRLPPVDAILDIVSDPPGPGTKHPVNRHILASHSAYFRKLFFGPWRDGELKEHVETIGSDGKMPHYTINGDRADRCIDGQLDFGMMIASVQLFGSNVHELHCLEAMYGEERVERCLGILKMAAKFELPIWLQYGQQMLISNGPGTMEALEVAESLNLPALKEHCLEMLDPLYYTKHFGANQRIYARLSEQTQQLVDKCLENNSVCYYSYLKRAIGYTVEEEEEEDH